MLTRLTSLSSRSSLSAALFLLHFFFFFNDTAPTEIYTLSLHDALPICQRGFARRGFPPPQPRCIEAPLRRGDRKSTRLNSSHVRISYAVFCLKKKHVDVCRHGSGFAIRKVVFTQPAEEVIDARQSQMRA